MQGRKTLRNKSRSRGSRKMYRKGGMISGISSGSSSGHSSGSSLLPFTRSPHAYLGSPSSFNYPDTWAGKLLKTNPTMQNECSLKDEGETLICIRGDHKILYGSDPYRSKNAWDKKTAEIKAKELEKQKLVTYYNETIDNTKKRTSKGKVALGRRCKWQLIGSECINGATCRKANLNSVGLGNYCLPKGYRTNVYGDPPLTIEEIDENSEATKFKPLITKYYR